MLAPQGGLAEQFQVDARHHGQGPILFRWHPRSTYVASSGSSRVVHVHDRHGALVKQIVPPSPRCERRIARPPSRADALTARPFAPARSMCTALEWNAPGTILAIVQANSPIIVLWELATRETRFIDTECRSIAFLHWASHALSLAVGTDRGAVHLYDYYTGARTTCAPTRRRRLTCGAWSTGPFFTVATEGPHVRGAADRARADVTVRDRRSSPSSARRVRSSRRSSSVARSRP